MRIVAALYVQQGGCYYGLPDVDPWDATRDARTYAGPHPVVAHPPCERWGKYWHGGPSAKARQVKGDDAGCFASALESVRRFGGVLEHPAASAAWARYGLFAPPFDGAWVTAGDFTGWTCHVEQGHYGHRARKATWLYAARVKSLPSLKWGPSSGSARVDGCGFHTTEERRRKLAGMSRAEYVQRQTFARERLGKRERAATPLPFRDLLLEIARSAA